MHESSDCHRSATLKLHAFVRGINVEKSLSKAKQDEMIAARDALHKIFTSLVFLAKQGLAIRGKTDVTSNLQQPLELRGNDSVNMQSWLARTQCKWLSHDIQNEILQLLSNDVVRRLLHDIRAAQFFALMLDETTDASRHEQMAVCVRFTDDELNIHEIFMGFYVLEHQDADTLYRVVEDVLHRFNFSLASCRGQCYDGAANVAGRINGLQARVRRQESRALFVHCGAHSLNLVVQDAVSCTTAYRDALAI
jgi:hypothetical protein